MINNIAIIGLGKLGASMAGCLASRGFNVIGADVSQKTVDALNAGRAPVQVFSDVVRESRELHRIVSL